MLKTLLFAAITVMAIALIKPPADNQLTPKEKKEGWVLLFDGKTTKGWVNYKGKEQDAWRVTNGELYCPTEGVSQHGDIRTEEQFADFELKFDWKIAPGKNSGVMYRVTEEYKSPYASGPEYQLIDDKGYPHQLDPKQMTATAYDMYACTTDATKPAGEYNQSRILVKGAHVEHWLNNVKVLEYELWSDDWKTRKAGSKWKEFEGYGMSKTGYIDFQDHGGGVWIKNVKLRKL